MLITAWKHLNISFKKIPSNSLFISRPCCLVLLHAGTIQCKIKKRKERKRKGKKNEKEGKLMNMYITLNHSLCLIFFLHIFSNILNYFIIFIYISYKIFVHTRESMI